MILIMLLCIMLVLGHAERITLQSYPVSFFTIEIVLYPIIVYLVWKYIKNFHTQHKPHIGIGPIVLIVMNLTFLFSIPLYTFSENLIAFSYLIRFSLLMFLYDLIVTVKSTSQKKFSSIALLTIGVTFGAILQYIYYPDFQNIAYLGWDPHAYRLVGFFFEPPIAAGVYGMLGIWWARYARTQKAPWAYLITCIASVAVFLSYSRIAILALGVVAVMWLPYLKKMQIIILCTVVISIFIFLPKGSNESINLLRTTSIMSRAVDLHKGWRIYLTHPWTGIGYNHIRVEKDKFIEAPLTEIFNPSHSSTAFHNSFLVILVTGGLWGLGIYLLWYCYAASISPLMRDILVYLGVLSLADNVLLHFFILCMMVVVRWADITHPYDTSHSK